MVASVLLTRPKEGHATSASPEWSCMKRFLVKVLHLPIESTSWYVQIAFWVPSLDWCCDARVVVPAGIVPEASWSSFYVPMVHTRDQEPVAQVVRYWLDWQEVLGSRPPGVHSLVWLSNSCWGGLTKVESYSGLDWSRSRVTVFAILRYRAVGAWRTLLEKCVFFSFLRGRNGQIHVT